MQRLRGTMVSDERCRCKVQMHVQLTELDPPVPLVGHFFRHLLSLSLSLPPLFLSQVYADSLASCHICNRTSTARSVLVADFGPWKTLGRLANVSAGEP